MWNTVDGLARLFYASQWAMAILGAVTAAAIVFSIVVSVRKDVLVKREQEALAQQERTDAEARQKTIDGQNQEISALKDKLGTTEGKLREITAQRSLTPEQKESILAVLKKYPPQEIRIMRMDDMETQTYAEEISQVLVDAKWTIARAPFRIITHAIPGLMILVTDMNAPPAGALALQEAFDKAGIPAPGGASTDAGPDKFILWVGPKVLKK
jgi:hypothetical protein